MGRNGNQGSATGQKDQKASLSHLLKNHTQNMPSSSSRKQLLDSLQTEREGTKKKTIRLRPFRCYYSSSSYNTQQKIIKNNRSTPVSHVDDTRSTGPTRKVSPLINSIHGWTTPAKFFYTPWKSAGQQSPKHSKAQTRVSVCRLIVIIIV